MAEFILDAYDDTKNYVSPVELRQDLWFESRPHENGFRHETQLPENFFEKDSMSQREAGERLLLESRDFEPYLDQVAVASNREFCEFKDTRMVSLKVRSRYLLPIPQGLLWRYP